MDAKAKAIQTLFRAGKINADGVMRAVTSGVITKEQCEEILGKDYR